MLVCSAPFECLITSLTVTCKEDKNGPTTSHFVNVGWILKNESTTTKLKSLQKNQIRMFGFIYEYLFFNNLLLI